MSHRYQELVQGISAGIGWVLCLLFFDNRRHRVGLSFAVCRIVCLLIRTRLLGAFVRVCRCQIAHSDSGAELYRLSILPPSVFASCRGVGVLYPHHQSSSSPMARSVRQCRLPHLPVHVFVSSLPAPLGIWLVAPARPLYSFLLRHCNLLFVGSSFLATRRRHKLLFAPAMASTQASCWRS